MILILLHTDDLLCRNGASDYERSPASDPSPSPPALDGAGKDLRPDHVLGKPETGGDARAGRQGVAGEGGQVPPPGRREWVEAASVLGEGEEELAVEAHEESEDVVAEECGRGRG